MDLDFNNLYANGVIASWYLKHSQMQFYRMLRTLSFIVSECHRRFGKGTTVLTYASERCLKEKITVRYIAETQGQAYQIFNFLISKIFYKCPHLKPKLSKGRYVFEQTGAEVYIGGVKDSGEIDKLRGVESDIIICDEFGFWKFKAEYILKSVLWPQLLETNGQMIITSTPPEDLTHNYVDQVINAEMKGHLFKWTIEDSYNIGEKTQKEVEDIIEDCGGVDSVHFKREYMCELIPTRERLVIPEAQNEELYVGTQERPPFINYYICMDLGLIDHTAVLFGYLDFKKSVLVIEDEYFENYNSTSEIVAVCREKEIKLNGSANPNQVKSIRRIGDCELQQLYDMSKDHNYPVSPITKKSRLSGKGFRDSVINHLRIGIMEGKVLIDPQRCPNLVKQLKYGIWNERRTDFERTETMGHLDALICLCYLYDNIAWNINPYPGKFDPLKQSDSFINMDELRKRDRQRVSFGKLLGR